MSTVTIDWSKERYNLATVRDTLNTIQTNVGDVYSCFIFLLVSSNCNVLDPKQKNDKDGLKLFL